MSMSQPAIFDAAAASFSQSSLKIFKKPDGGMSYLVKTSCPTDQGAKAAVPGSVEGDVNGCLCAMGIIPSIYSGLDIEDTMVSLFDPEDFERYIGIITAREEAYKAGNFKQEKHPAPVAE